MAMNQEGYPVFKGLRKPLDYLYKAHLNIV